MDSLQPYWVMLALARFCTEFGPVLPGSRANIRERKQWRKRPRGQRLVKNKYIFYLGNLKLSRSVQCSYRSHNLVKLNMQCQRSVLNGNTKNKPPSFAFSKVCSTWSFHVVVLQKTAKICTKNHDARAQPLFCSLNVLFVGSIIAVAAVVCLSSVFYSAALVLC